MGGVAIVGSTVVGYAILGRFTEVGLIDDLVTAGKEVADFRNASASSNTARVCVPGQSL